jgi:putative transposase
MLLETNAVLAMDAGITKLFHTSNNQRIENPRFFERTQKRLARAQRKVSRRKKFSKRWKKACILVAKIHQLIANQRKDFLHKLSTQIIRQFGRIAIEDLNVKGLAKGMLSKQVLDASWSMLFNFLDYKAERAGRIIIRVDPNGTSQTCICGNTVKKKLKDRIHQCGLCGLVADRDFVSALVIEQRAFHTTETNLTRRVVTLDSLNNTNHYPSGVKTECSRLVSA